MVGERHPYPRLLTSKVLHSLTRRRQLPWSKPEAASLLDTALTSKDEDDPKADVPAVTPNPLHQHLTTAEAAYRCQRPPSIARVLMRYLYPSLLRKMQRYQNGILVSPLPTASSWDFWNATEEGCQSMSQNCLYSIYFTSSRHIFSRHQLSPCLCSFEESMLFGLCRLESADIPAP